MANTIQIIETLTGFVVEIDGERLKIKGTQKIRRFKTREAAQKAANSVPLIQR